MVALFLKECKMHIKSLLYLVYVLLLSLFFLSQFWDFPIIVKPKENASGYGMTISSDPQVIMNKTMEELLQEFNNNQYSTYPIGFYKKVKLNEKKSKTVEKIIEEVTGLSIEEAEKYYMTYWENSPKSTGDYAVDTENTQKYEREHPFQILSTKDITYKKFEDCMEKINKILGGGSSYAKKNLPSNAYVPMTYEQAIQKYESIIRDDKITGAYARLFCDYMGLMLGLLPVFLAVSRELKDKKSNVALVIYSKKLSSLKMIGARYAAILVVSIIPVLVLGIILLAYALLQADSIGAAFDISLYFSYLGGWLLPTIMFTISLGILCSTLTGKAFGILIQAFLWIISIFSGNVKGQAGFNFIPRFNIFGSYSLFETMYKSFVINRISYLIISIILLIVSVAIFEKKRKGEIVFYGNLSSN